MPTTLTIMWRKAPTPGLIPLCSLYRSEFGTSAPQWDLLANDRISGMSGLGRKADFPHSGTPMAIADTTLRRQNDDEMEMRMAFKSHDRAATGA